MKCGGCGHINVHEALFCQSCGGHLEDWNRQSILRQAARAGQPAPPPPQKSEKGTSIRSFLGARMSSPAGGPATTSSASRRESAGRASAQIRTTATASSEPARADFRTAPTPSAAGPGRITAIDSGEPARADSWTQTPTASRPGGVDPWSAPPAAPAESGFVVATVPQEPASQSPAPVAVDARQLYEFARSYRGFVRSYVLCLVAWYVWQVLVEMKKAAPGAITSLFWLLWVGAMLISMYHAFRLVTALGCGPAPLVVLLALNVIGFFAAVALACAAYAWLDQRGGKCGFFGPDDAQLAILKQQADTG